MANIPKLISKTKIMQGYQCHKSLYLSVHRKELIPKVTPELQALFDQGNAVTKEARQRFPDGVLVDNPAYDFVGSLKKTRELLAAHTPVIFEAAFEYKGCYARADVIIYNELTQRWSIVEVKSTTKVKDEHLDDVGLQVWIMANAGLPIEKISLMHLNTLCKFPELNNLFIEEEVTDELRIRHTKISPKLNELFKALKSDLVPNIDLGLHCSKPRDCQFLDHCWIEKKIPQPSVFSIPGLREKKWDLYNQGYVNIQDIPSGVLSEKQQICADVLKTNKRYIDYAKIKIELSGWKFPLIFLDFETINPAIPRYMGTGPFMQVPFQFSVHILSSLNAELEHHEFIYDEFSDPRPSLIRELIRACNGPGSVVAYYGQFEAGRIQELEDFAPEFRGQLMDIRLRIVDPLPLFREAVYDSAFSDSYSIKNVGPAILGNEYSYQNMPVGDGSAAQRAYEELIAESTTLTRKNELKAALLNYCEKDTLVMVGLVKWLYNLP